MMSNAVLSRGVVLEDANVDQTFEVGAVVKGKVVVKPSSRGTRQRQLVGLPEDSSKVKWTRLVGAARLVIAAAAATDRDLIFCKIPKSFRKIKLRIPARIRSELRRLR